MYNASLDFQNYIKMPSRTLSSRLVVGSNTYTDTDIVDMSLESNLVPGEEFTLGTTICNKFEATIMTNNLIQALNEVKPYIGLDIGGTVEEVPLGVFIVDDVKTVKGTKQIVAYDNMIKFEKAYFSDLVYPATIQAVATEICQKAGVSFNSVLPNYTIDKIEGKTLREAIGIIAGICGGFARINRVGALEIVGLTSTDINITSENFFGSIEKADKDFTIKKITAIREDNSTISSGSGLASEEITFSNNYITQAQLDTILTTYNNYSYRTLKLNWQGNPALDVGDTITITDIDNTVYTIPVMRLKLTYSGGLKSEISSVAKSDSKSEYNYKGSITTKVENIVTEQANIRNILAEKVSTEELEAVNARIDNLKVDTAMINDLAVTNAKIANGAITGAKIATATIDTANIKDASITTAKIKDGSITNAKIATAAIDTANIKDLAVTSAKIANGAIDNAKIANASISTAKIQNGAITTALIGTGAVQTAQIADGSITDAKIVSLTANKITAGTIDASNINVINLKADNITTGALTIDGDNLIHNTNFANNTNYWTIDSNKWVRDTSLLYDNVVTMKSEVTGETSDKYYGLYSEFTNITEGQSLVGSVYVYTNDKSTIDNGVYMQIEWYNSSNTRIYASAQSILPDNNSTWQRFVLTDTAPTGTVKARLRFRLTRNGRIWIAKPMLQRGSVASEWKLHTDEQISNGAITNAKIANSAVDGNKIASNSVTNTHISANTITGDKLVADTITAREIASKTITANEIASNTITADSAIIADAAITTAKIADGSITNAKIANASIDNAKIANATITGAKIANATITGANIASATIDTANIKDAAITNAKIASLDASKITTGTMTADRIQGGTLTLGGVNNGNGMLNVYSNDGILLANIDKNGIKIKDNSLYVAIEENFYDWNLGYVTETGTLYGAESINMKNMCTITSMGIEYDYYIVGAGPWYGFFGLNYDTANNSKYFYPYNHPVINGYYIEFKDEATGNAFISLSSLNVDSEDKYQTTIYTDTEIKGNLKIGSGMYQTGLNTTNTSSSNSNKWTKIASLTIKNQYEDCDFIAMLNTHGNGSQSTWSAMLHCRLKQQNAMGGVPYVMVNGHIYDGFVADDFKAVTVQNDTSATVVEIYVKNRMTYNIISVNPIHVYGNVEFYSNQELLSTLPTGTQTNFVVSNFTGSNFTGSTGYFNKMILSDGIYDSTGEIKIINSTATSLLLVGPANCGIELGRTDGVASTPFIDFHGGATATDYDARIILTDTDTLQVTGAKLSSILGYSNIGKSPAYTWSGTINYNAYVTITHNLGYNPIIQTSGSQGNMLLTFLNTDNNNTRVYNYNGNYNNWTGTIYFW